MLFAQAAVDDGRLIRPGRFVVEQAAPPAPDARVLGEAQQRAQRGGAFARELFGLFPPAARRRKPARAGARQREVVQLVEELRKAAHQPLDVLVVDRRGAHRPAGDARRRVAAVGPVAGGLRAALKERHGRSEEAAQMRK